jgi:hypothetical protein
MAFNSYTPFAVWASTVVRGTKSVSGLLKFPGVDDPRELETWNPRLKLVREMGSLHCAVRHRTSRPARHYGRMLAHSGSVPFRFQERS